MMKQCVWLIVALLVAGCGGRPGAPVGGAPGAGAGTPAATESTAVGAAQSPGPTASDSPPAAPAPALPADPRPDLWVQPPRTLSRDQVRDGLLRWVQEAPGTPQAGLDKLKEARYSSGEGLPWLEADLDGNGESEFVLALPVDDGDGRVVAGQGAALFVIYRKDGRWAVDRSDPMDSRMEFELMAPVLHGAADLAGTGHPQIVWSRPELIATGPQPYFVFVTAWQPGRFTNLPGTIALSRPKITLDGRDVVLTGMSRNNTYLPVKERTDRYRYVDGAFRLVDRRFTDHPEDGYARFWDGLVAEESGRLEDAAAAYRTAADPQRPAHSGSVEQYHMAPRELTAAELAQFGAALRPFARFRLGALLLQAGRKEEALAVLQPDGGPYDGLTAALRGASDRKSGCAAGQAWAAAHPDFLKALNIGVGTAPWTPEVICSHIDINEHGFWEPQ